MYYIYVNLFWAYIKDASGSWRSVVEETIQDVAPGSDAELKAALQRCATQTRWYNQTRSAVGCPARANSASASNSDMSEDFY